MERRGFCASFGPILSAFRVFAVCKIWQIVLKSMDGIHKGGGNMNDGF